MKYLNLKPVEFEKLSASQQRSIQWRGRILLPKYDGCFAMVAIKEGRLDFIMSRTGELTRSMDHITNGLLAQYEWLRSGQHMVLGEAWTPGMEFNEISGLFRRQSQQPRLGFAPFDTVRYAFGQLGLPRLSSSLPYYVRISMLEGKMATDVVHTPSPIHCDSLDHGWAYARHLKEQGGFDGAVCSSFMATYAPGSGKGGEFIKLKPILSYSLECVGYEAALGEKTGRGTGALVVRFRGKTCKVTTGLDYEQQANLAQFVGKVIEVGAMGISSNGLLREPRFKGVRDDAVAEA